MRYRRLTAVALALTLGVTGCGILGPKKTDRGWQPGAPSASASNALWRADLQGDAVAIGDVLVTYSKEKLTGTAISTGKKLWERGGFSDVKIASDLIAGQSSGGPLEVVDPVTGSTRWKTAPYGLDKLISVSQTRVYDYRCDSSFCGTTARDIADGHTLWTLKDAFVNDDWIGARSPQAASDGPYVLAQQGDDVRFLVDARTGRRLAAKLPRNEAAWWTIPVGSTAVYTDNDPESSDSRCTVELKALDGSTGAKKWSAQVFGGRGTDNKCDTALNAGFDSGWLIVSSGTQIAALTSTGMPQVFDFATGKTVWTAAQHGAPIDMDGQSVLVRATVDSGALALLDAKTGQQRWTAPDPGLESSSASWRTRLSGRLVAVSGGVQKDGYKAPIVIVYDETTGRELARRDGWLAGVGDNWVAVTHSDENNVSKQVLDFIRFH
jgi:hypothetical protein